MNIKRKHASIVGSLFEKLAPRIGARVVFEPEWNVAGQIVYKSGRTRYFRFSSIDLNTLGASEIAKDKDYASFFMKKMGYSVIEGKTFFSEKWARAIKSKRTIDVGYRYAETLGFPVIVKPNSQSQGRAVALVHTKGQFYRAMRAVFKVDRVALVQRYVAGKDYRIVVLDDRVISAYERIPLSVAGDGRSTILQLLKKKQREFVLQGRDTVIQMNDPRMVEKLRRCGMSFTSKPKKDTRVYLLDNANLSSGGDSIDVTDEMHEDFRTIAIRLTKDMGLRLCGVDLMLADDIRNPAGSYVVLEINAAPGLDHYVTGGAKQQKIVEDLYLEVLKAMEL